MHDMVLFLMFVAIIVQLLDMSYSLRCIRDILERMADAERSDNEPHR